MYIIPSLTRVKALTRIRRERMLPRAGEVTVRSGQQVNPEKVVARASRPTGFHVIPAGTILDVPAEEVTKYLLVEEGAAVERGQLLLQKSGLFGRQRIKAPLDGVLYRVSNGRLVLQQTPEMVEVRAAMNGMVAAIRPGRGVVIETNGALIQAFWSTGQDGNGKITVVADDPKTPLHADHIGADARGSVLVAGHLHRADVLDKAEENSVRGIIVGSIPAGMQARLRAANMAIIATEGFGHQPMAGPIFQLLQQLEGREASLFGHTMDNWGTRPEIVIPLPSTEAVDKPATTLQPLTIGQTVRILRPPYVSQAGEVVAVHTRPRTTGTGLRMPGADVALPDGQVAFMPYPNLDLIS